MSRILTITVDLAESDADKQLTEAIEAMGVLASALTKASAPGKEKDTGAHSAAAPAPAATTAPPPPPPIEDKEKAETGPGVDDKAKSETAPPPPPTVAASSLVDLDAEGLPWDGRIHGANRKKLVKGGTWKLKRGVDQALVDQIKAELRATMAAPGPAETLATVEPNPQEIFGAVPPPPVITEEEEDAIMTFPELVQVVTDRTSKGTLTPEALDEILARHKMPTLPSLASRPDLIPGFFKDLQAVPHG